MIRALLAIVIVASSVSAHAAPCTDCKRALPPHADGLLVVLHGDDTGADGAFADWRRAAAAANLALFAPECPRALGCNGSWWRWAQSKHHDPQWLADQIASVAAAAGVQRVYLAGYSGGASYLASWALAHPDAALAVAYVAGGYLATRACPDLALRALVVVGDDDDMRDDYALPFARWLAGCTHATVETRTVPHLGHHATHGALRGTLGDEVVAWLTAGGT
jgi:poly(3-hydroxybutyrate) depolymerase